MIELNDTVLSRRLEDVLRRRFTNLFGGAIELFDFARRQTPSQRTEIIFELTHVFRPRNGDGVFAHAPIERHLRAMATAMLQETQRRGVTLVVASPRSGKNQNGGPWFQQNVRHMQGQRPTNQSRYRVIRANENCRDQICLHFISYFEVGT